MSVAIAEATLSPRRTGRLLAALIALSGILFSFGLLAPMPAGTHRLPLFVINLVAVALGVAGWFAPWARLRWACFWVFVSGALAVIALSNGLGGFEPFSYAAYFTVVFVWVGIASPRWTSLLVLPLAVVAYVVPLHLLDQPPEDMVTVAWVLPVWLLVAESLAWVVDKLRRAEVTLLRSHDNVARLLVAATGLGASVHNEAEAADTIARVARTLLGSSSASVLLPDPDLADVLRQRGGTGDGLPLAGPSISMGSSLSGLLDAPWICSVDGLAESTLRTLLRDAGAEAAKVIALDELDDLAGSPRLGGVIVVGWTASAMARPDADLMDQAARLLRTEGARLLHQARIVERLSRDAETDPLTGLANRRRLRRLMDDLTPGGALAVIDLDQFKVVNDRFGHASGDQVLRDFAGCLRRVGDMPARLGGEEFVLVCPTGGAAAASLAMQRLRDMWQERPRLTTFSAGVAEMTETERPADVLHRADEALYEAKAAGRNRTAVADPAVAHLRDAREGALQGRELGDIR
jgi:diguanylate cyclase (GGDEF)-like protein